jgi:phospholipase C
MAGVGRWRTTAASTVVVAVLIGWATTLAGVTSPPAQARAAHPDQPSHLIVMVEENHAFEQVSARRRRRSSTTWPPTAPC